MKIWLGIGVLLLVVFQVITGRTNMLWLPEIFTPYVAVDKYEHPYIFWFIVISLTLSGVSMILSGI